MITTQTLSGRLGPPLLILAAALCGFFAWGYGLTPLAALVVPLWFLSASRLQAWLIMLAYFMAGSRTIPLSSAVFFEQGTSIGVGLLLWCLSAALLAAPWALFRPTATLPARIAHLTAAISLSVLPPIGLIGWTNPWLGAALIVPGLGWASLLIGYALLAACAYMPRGRPLRNLAGASVVALTAAVGTVRELPPPPDHWIGVEMHAGQAPENAQEQLARQLAIVHAVDTALAQGKRVIVLPEQILGTWSDTWRLFLEATIGQALHDAGAVLVVGAAVPTGHEARTTNAMLTFDGQSWAQANARFAIPVSMWKPWRHDSTEVEWFTSGIYDVSGQRIMLSLCYEDLLVWTSLLSFAHKPDLIVSMANAWWAGAGPAILDIQREHIEAWARIFNVPLVRALNAP